MTIDNLVNAKQKTLDCTPLYILFNIVVISYFKKKVKPIFWSQEQQQYCNMDTYRQDKCNLPYIVYLPTANVYAHVQYTNNQELFTCFTQWNIKMFLVHYNTLCKEFNKFLVVTTVTLSYTNCKSGYICKQLKALLE